MSESDTQIIDGSFCKHCDECERSDRFMVVIRRDGLKLICTNHNDGWIDHGTLTATDIERLATAASAQAHLPEGQSLTVPESQ